MTQKQIVLTVNGMVCTGCESAIENALEKLNGIQEVKASHTEKRVGLSYTPAQVDEITIIAAIVAAGYTVVVPQPVKLASDATSEQPPPTRAAEQTQKVNRRIRNVLIFIALLIIIGGVVQWGRSLMPGVMMQMNASLSYAALFMIGLLTGFHCIGMCGSFVVNYTQQTKTLGEASLAHAAYGGGKTLSYAVLGALFGLLGALITITPSMRGWAAMLAGVFLLLFGLQMLHLIPSLRILSLNFPKAMTKRVMGSLGKPRSPLSTGLLNGLLLGCGPLQAMYIMAAGTGSPVEGALMLTFFGLGTLPPLLGFGFFASYLSQKSIQQLISVSGVLVIFMGLMMLNRGYTMLNAMPAMMGMQ